ncbi:hypothetical protein [Paenibacillus agaridevorans]|uniref:hypothetical protein n=1 Tax=Paenibacillus agaridevorans TaxID=171404 RepID=UPI001BE49C0B|nr:hypothetical protein [Paenibacillus agaridevorans]
MDLVANADSFVRSTNLCINLYITSYLFGDYKKALRALDQCEIMIRSNPNQILDISSQHYYVVLVLKEALRDRDRYGTQCLRPSDQTEFVGSRALAKKVQDIICTNTSWPRRSYPD